MKVEVDFVLISSFLLFGMLATFIILFIVRFRQSQNQFIEEKKLLEERMKFENTQAQLEISEQIMENVSFELHDNIAQTLTLVKLQISSKEIPIDDAKERLTQAISDVRNFSRSLNGNYVLQLGLEEAIKREINHITAIGEIQGSLDFNIPPYNDSRDVVLFRCIQEAINNSIKYAKASTLNVSAKTKDKLHEIHVADNGVGIAENVVHGIGFQSMNKRIQLLGGSMEIRKNHPSGTIIIFSLPSP